MQGDVVPIFHQTRVLNWMLFVIPVVALVSCYVYFVVEHKGEGYVPPLSTILEDTRIHRIYSVLMTFQCVFATVVFYIRSQVFDITARIRGVAKSRRFSALTHAINLSEAFMCVGCFCMSFISHDLSYIASVVAVALYSVGGICYAICNDCMLGLLHTSSQLFSRILTWTSIVVTLLCITCLALIARNDKGLNTVAGALESMTFLGIQLKITLVGIDMPQHVVRMVAKK